MKQTFKSKALVVLLIGIAAVAWAREPDSDHTLEVHRALPPYMIEGPHFRVVDPVVNIFALDQFTIESDFGTFEAYGQLALRVRIREITAIAALQQVDTKKAASGAAGRQVKESVKAVGQVAAHPIKSAKGIASGIGRRFRKLGRDIAADVATARSDTTSEEKAAIYADRWLGIDKARRRLAGELRIDPYSENPVLQAELQRVAKAEAGGSLGAKLLIPSIPGTSLIEDVHKIVTTYDARELLAFNKKRLRKLGAKKADIEYFLTMDAYTPTSASLLIGLILELDGVENQVAIFEQALITDSAIDAMFFAESVMMAVWYHKNFVPLDRMLLVTGLPAAETRENDAVVFAATDFPHWTHEQAGIMIELDAAYKSIASNPKILLAGRSSGTFSRQVEEMGWTLRYDVRNEYLDSIPWAVDDEELLAK